MARALLALAVLTLAPLAAAQDMTPDAPPISGTLTPRGEDAASATFDVRAHTEVPITACYGYVDPSAPDVVVEWGGGDLRLWVRATFDATLAVHTPDGDWQCDDDTDGVSPVVAMTNAPAGRYAVWLGAFSPDPAEPGATLLAGAPPPPPVLDASAAALAGEVEAIGGFEASQGTLTYNVRAGGPDPAPELDLHGTPEPPEFCSGYIDAGQPTIAVAYDADGGTGVLAISATAVDTDLVLVVMDPSGRVYCNDDFGGTDPAIVIDQPTSGTYTAWVGTFSMEAEPVGSMLVLSETAPEMEEFYDDFEGFDDIVSEPFTEGTYSALDLGTPPSVRLSVTDAVDTADVTIVPTAENPVSGGACRGYIEMAPTAAIALRGDGPFALTASSDEDLTLTVRTPSGGWFCSDDADGLDPGIQIDAPEAGTYLAWVGSYANPGGEVEATISAAPGEIVVTQPSYGPDPYHGPTQSEATYDGAEIRPGDAAARLTFDEMPVTETVRPGGSVVNPVEGDACFGFISERPTVAIASTGDLAVSVSGEDDLTLVVLGPDGSWTCSDDADGTNPEAVVYAGPGTYSVWVGTYYRRDEPEATLRVEAAPDVVIDAPPPPPAPEVIRG